MASMSWHHSPKDDAWKQAHLAMLVRVGKRAWLHCDDCRHSIMIEPHELAQRHQLDVPRHQRESAKLRRAGGCPASGLKQVDIYQSFWLHEPVVADLFGTTLGTFRV
jgi:hypothetical protein